jgi:hypothetical protein
MEPGDTLYVEYIEDRETFDAMRRGVPLEETRLGRPPTQCGFRIVRDWYFLEGWLEGGMKLQAEKVWTRPRAGPSFCRRHGRRAQHLHLPHL